MATQHRCGSCLVHCLRLESTWIFNCQSLAQMSELRTALHAVFDPGHWQHAVFDPGHWQHRTGIQTVCYVRKRKGPSAKAAHNKSNNSSKRVQNANVVPQKCKGKTVLSIKTQDQPTSAVAVRAKMASSKSAPIISGSVLPSHSGPVNKAAVTKAWAGPSFYKSPAPECLPLPTSYLLAV